MMPRITLDIEPDVAQELDRYKARLRATHPGAARDRETTASALITAWAHAQQRKRDVPITQQPKR